MDEDEVYPSGNIRLYTCDICERKFKQESLAKHRIICQKANSHKRKVFDSGKQRVEGTGIDYRKTRETQKVQLYGERPEQEHLSLWREKHNDLIKSVRRARYVSEAVRTGAPIPKFEPSAVPSDYVNCPYCDRNFSRKAAERHIPFCETLSKRNAVKQQQQQQQHNSANNRLKQQQQQQQQQQTLRNAASGDNNGYKQQSSYAATNSRHVNGGSGGGSTYNQRKPVRYDANSYYDSDEGYPAHIKPRSQQQHVTSYSRQHAPAAQMREMQQQQQQEQMLRTGRNPLNSNLNALARTRSGSQKESPGNSSGSSTSSGSSAKISTFSSASSGGGAAVSRSFVIKPMPNKILNYKHNLLNGKKQQQQQPQSNVRHQQQHQQTSPGTIGFHVTTINSSRSAANAAAIANNSNNSVGSKFCHECGTEFPVDWAKFCCYCGESRIVV